MVQGTPVLWSSKKQPIMTKSTTAVEYVAASMAADEAILIQKTLEDMGTPQSPIPLLCDNTAAEALLKNPIDTGRTKQGMANKHIYAYKHILKIIPKDICFKKMFLGGLYA
jgi:hypothetical protein